MLTSCIWHLAMPSSEEYSKDNYAHVVKVNVQNQSIENMNVHLLRHNLKYLIDAKTYSFFQFIPKERHTKENVDGVYRKMFSMRAIAKLQKKVGGR